MQKKIYHICLTKQIWLIPPLKNIVTPSCTEEKSNDISKTYTTVGFYDDVRARPLL